MSKVKLKEPKPATVNIIRAMLSGNFWHIYWNDKHIGNAEDNSIILKYTDFEQPWSFTDENIFGLLTKVAMDSAAMRAAH